MTGQSTIQIIIKFVVCDSVFHMRVEAQATPRGAMRPPKGRYSPGRAVTAQGGRTAQLTTRTQSRTGYWPLFPETSADRRSMLMRSAAAARRVAMIVVNRGGGFQAQLGPG